MRGSGYGAWLRRIALAIFALVVTLDFALPGVASARLVAAAFQSVRESNAERDVRHLEKAHPIEEQTSLEVKPIEADDDDDDDSLHEVGHRRDDTFRIAPSPRKPHNVVGDIFAVDTSRFVFRPGLPRGPPV